MIISRWFSVWSQVLTVKSLCQLGCYVNQIVTEENIEGRVGMMQSEMTLGFPSDLRNGEFLQFKATSVNRVYQGRTATPMCQALWMQPGLHIANIHVPRLQVSGAALSRVLIAISRSRKDHKGRKCTPVMCIVNYEEGFWMALILLFFLFCAMPFAQLTYQSGSGGTCNAMQYQQFCLRV